ncbi:MAG: hypothetical protein V5A25_13175 [Halovenus sp.]
MPRKREGSAEQLEGREKNRAVADALSDEETRRLNDHLARSGWMPSFHDATAHLMQLTDDEEFKLVTIPYRRAGGPTSRSGFLTWPDHGKGRTTVTLIDDTVQERYFIEDDKVVRESTDIEELVGNAQDGISTTDDCTYFEERCADPNWTCLAEIAVLYGSCSWAVITGNLVGVLLCLSSAGVNIIQAADNEGCSLCDSTYIAEVNLCRFPGTGGNGPGSP